MHGTDIRNGQRGHRNQDEPAPSLLSAEQAAPLLGCTVRHVRRLIAQGDLAGHKDPYRTWPRAVEAYRRRAQPVEGDVVTAEQHEADLQMSACGQVGSGEPDQSDTESTAVMVAIAAELGSARDQIERLARENGRLAAQLEQVQTQGPPRLRRPRSSAVRLLRWLRAGGRP